MDSTPYITHNFQANSCPSTRVQTDQPKPATGSNADDGELTVLSLQTKKSTSIFITSFSISNVNISVVFNQVIISEFISVSWAPARSFEAERMTGRMCWRTWAVAEHSLLWHPRLLDSLSSYLLLFPKDWVSDLGNLLFPNFPSNILSEAWYSFY